MARSQAVSTAQAGSSPFYAGKNKFINGDFRINQRAFSSTTTHGTYGFDRWKINNSDGTVTYSAQTFTAGAAPVAGYEAVNYARIVTTGQTATSAYAMLVQQIEDVRTFAGQTVTVSFWAKATTGTPKIAVVADQYFGTGGSPSSDVLTAMGQPTISTSWARYSVTATIPSISGKTIGTNASTHCLEMRFFVSAGSNFNTQTNSLGIQSNTFELWGIQIEAGSVATAFQTATGTLQGELAACQRYYYRITGTNTYSNICPAYTQSTNSAVTQLSLPVEMRVAPTSVDYSNIRITNFSGASAVTAATLGVFNGKNNVGIALDVAGTPFTAFVAYHVSCNNNAAGYLGVSAEL